MFQTHIRVESHVPPFWSLTDPLNTVHLEEHRDAEELKLDPRWGALGRAALREAVLQGRRQEDESHRAVEGRLVDEYLQHGGKCMHSPFFF